MEVFTRRWYDRTLVTALGPDSTVTLVANSDVGDRCGFHGISRRYSCFWNTNKRVFLEAGWYGWGIRHQCHCARFLSRGVISGLSAFSNSFQMTRRIAALASS